MNSKQSSTLKKFLKQVGNIVAVQAIAGAATEMGKAVWPKVKEKLNGLLDRADEMHKAKETRKDLRDLVKNSAMHYKKTNEPKQAPPLPEAPTEPTDPPVDATFVP